MPEFNNDAPKIAEYIDHGLAMLFSAAKGVGGALLDMGDKISNLASSAWEGAKSFVPGAGFSSPVTPKQGKNPASPERVRVKAPEVSAPSMGQSRSIESMLPSNARSELASLGAGMSGLGNSGLGNFSQTSWNQFAGVEVNPNEQFRALTTPSMGFGGRGFAMSV